MTRPIDSSAPVFATTSEPTQPYLAEATAALRSCKRLKSDTMMRTTPVPRLATFIAPRTPPRSCKTAPCPLWKRALKEEETAAPSLEKEQEKSKR